MGTQRCRGCWGLAFILALLFGLILLPFTKGSIDQPLVDEAGQKLTDAKIDGVSASSDWAAITLTGPPSARAKALAAVESMKHRSAVDSVTYQATGADQSVTGAAAKAAITVDPDPKIVLTGRVASASQRTTLVAAATKAVGADSVEDQLKVDDLPAKVGVDDAVKAMAGLLGPLSTGATAASVSIADTELTVSGIGKSAAAAAAVDTAVAAAKKAGVSVSGKLTAPSSMPSEPAPSPSPVEPTPSPSATAPKPDPVELPLAAQLAAIPGIKAIRFATASAALTPSSQVTLDRVAEVLRATDAKSVKISGFTDNRGSQTYNLELSRQRATAVRAYLISKGVAAPSLTAAGFGPASPIATNATEAGRSANRRIEFTVQGS